MERLCGAKPIGDHDGKALQSKANPEKLKGFATEATPISQNEEHLRCKAKPAKWKGFAKQSQSINMMERLCKAKPTHHDGKALRSKANSS